jgi:2-polyprenyl-3-methyl-5-hydroxy-6-metoxy-1,4-benzoquinol methylase
MKVIRKESPREELFGFQLFITELVEKRFLAGRNILDIGCGFGWFVNYALNQKPKKITGLDSSKEALKIAKRLKGPVDFVVGTATLLPFKNNTFDTIVSWEVIEHIPKNTESLMFSEIYRVLKPGSYFFCSTQHANFFSTILDPAWWLIGHRHYRTKTLHNLVESSGLKVKKVYVKGSIFAILYTLNLYISKWIFRRDIFLKKFFYKKLTTEFVIENGYADIILKCQKPK